MKPKMFLLLQNSQNSLYVVAFVFDNLAHLDLLSIVALVSDLAHLTLLSVVALVFDNLAHPDLLSFVAFVLII